MSHLLLLASLSTADATETIAGKVVSGVTAEKIAAATSQIAVATFVYQKVDWTLKCKGTSGQLSCSATGGGKSAAVSGGIINAVTLDMAGKALVVTIADAPVSFVLGNG